MTGLGTIAYCSCILYHADWLTVLLYVVCIPYILIKVNEIKNIVHLKINFHCLLKINIKIFYDVRFAFDVRKLVPGLKAPSHK